MRLKVNSLKKSGSQVDWVKNKVQKQLILQMQRINDYLFLFAELDLLLGRE